MLQIKNSLTKMYSQMGYSTFQASIWFHNIYICITSMHA